MNHKFPTCSETVHTRDEAVEAACRLMSDNVWTLVTENSDHSWLVTVKQESIEKLQHVLDDLNT